MQAERTTVAIQRYLDDLRHPESNSPAEPVIRDLLGLAARRLHLLCARLLSRSYPRLARPPVNLQATELLSAVTERMLKAMREARPVTVRQFFHIASQHMRWELNDVARRLDKGPRAVELFEELVPRSTEPDTTVGPNVVRILEAIENLPDGSREAFDLVRIQGMSQPEAAELLGVSVRTVQRHLSSSVLLLSQELADLCPPDFTKGGADEPSA
ncbi:MAG: sigma-70 family RNA polymerase sigma factor [Phycisphaeraceae bacterium]|nr:sigma-70 family RNA polymerase sigma factor [Phycisphaeraceae bacterium]